MGLKFPPRESEIHESVTETGWGFRRHSPEARQRLLLAGPRAHTARIQLPSGSTGPRIEQLRGQPGLERGRAVCIVRLPAFRILRTLQAPLGHDSCRGRARSSLGRFRGEVGSGQWYFRGRTWGNAGFSKLAARRGAEATTATTAARVEEPHHQHFQSWFAGRPVWR